MSKETKLQKEFVERDVNRMRNIISKKYNNSTGVQSGYKKSNINHAEGDIWIENGKTWTIRSGIKMTVSKLDEVKNIMQLPLVCPCCSKRMKKDKLDKKMYFIHGKCFDCVIEYETKLRQEGKYEEYERSLMTKNIDIYIQDLNQLFGEICNISNDQIVTEEGDVEQWVGGSMDVDKIKKEFKKYIETVNKVKEQL